MVQLSHPYMTTGKTIALTRRTLVDKMMSLLFNMLSRLVITFHHLCLNSYCFISETILTWWQCICLQIPIEFLMMSYLICHHLSYPYPLLSSFPPPQRAKCMLKSESEVAQSCLTLCDPMDWSLPRSSIRGIFQATVLEWVAIFFSRGSSRPSDWTWFSCIVGTLASEPPGNSNAC